MKNITLVSLLLFCSAITAQHVQLNSNLGSGQVELHKVVTDNENGLLITGQCSNDTLTYADSSISNIVSSSFLIRIDSLGEVSWSHPIIANGGLTIISLQQVQNGDILMAGYYWDSVRFQNFSQTAGSSGRNPFFWRISAQGVLKNHLPLKDYPKPLGIVEVLHFENEYSILFNVNDSIWLPDSSVVRPTKSPGYFGLVLRLDTNDNILGYNIVDSYSEIYFMGASKVKNSIILTLNVESNDSIYINQNPIASLSQQGALLLKNQIDFNLISSNEINTDQAAWFYVSKYSEGDKLILYGFFRGSITLNSQTTIANNNYPGNPMGFSDGFAILIDTNLIIKNGFSIGRSSNNDAISGAFYKNHETLFSVSTGNGAVLFDSQDTIINLVKKESFILQTDTNINYSIKELSNTSSPLVSQTVISGIFPYKNGIGAYGFSNGDITFTNSTDTLFRRSSQVGFIWFFDSYLDLEKFQSRQQALSLYPNPSRHWVELKIELAQAEELLVEMLSLDGKGQRQLRHFSTEGQVGENLLRYSTSHLVPGLYLLRVRNQQGAVVGQEKLVVQ